MENAKNAKSLLTLMKPIKIVPLMFVMILKFSNQMALAKYALLTQDLMTNKEIASLTLAASLKF